MMASARLACAALVTLLSVQAGFCQSAGPAAWTPPAAPVVVPERDEAGQAPLPRWFCTLEGAAVWAWFGDAISPSPSYGLPKGLGTAVAPQTALGFRFESGAAFLVNYRYLSTSTKLSADDDDFAASDHLVHSNLTAHWLDFDYQSADGNAQAPLTLQWQTGLRVARLEYTVREETFSTWSSEENRLQADFLGAGPHFALRPRVNFGQTGLSLFGLADLGFEIGRATFETRVKSTWHDPSGTGLPITTSHKNTLQELLIMADARTELGLCYTSALSGLRFESGYRFAASVWGGRVFSDHGPFVRLGVGF